MKYVIAKSSIETLLILKSKWDKNPDDLLNIVHTFEANSFEEAQKYYENYIKV